MTTTSEVASSERFVIAALGASAGGLAALEEFFDRMPLDAGIAYIVVQHLSPDHASALGELLGKCTSMPVEQIRDNTRVQPDHVYVIPPNVNLTIRDRILRTAPRKEGRGRPASIDNLFSSLAEDCGEDAVCIMLSGAGSDGTRGLRAVKENGGMAMAQTLDTARFNAMLRSAIATGLVDHVLPVSEMPAKLVEYAAHLASVKLQSGHVGIQISKHSARIHNVLRRRVGHDFSQYREGTITRRLERRMKALQIDSVERYLDILEGQSAEAHLLFKDLLIGVTEFFRDPETFESLARDVIPELFDRHRSVESNGGPIRVCVVGCASGEEAYSLAILLSEHASTLEDPPEVKIFATDIDDRSLEIARKGTYPASIAERVSPRRLERFFERREDSYQVKRELREICLFSVHSFIKDPPFSRLDLISCRNVMIYLGEGLQRKVVPLFHYALRHGGYLFLGPSENVNAHTSLFRAVDKKRRIFQKKDTLPRPSVAFPLGEVSREKQVIGKASQADEQQLPRRLERIILQRYAPASVITNELGDAVYFSGGIARYLEQPSGKPDSNVVNMAREGLRIPLRAALHRAAASRERVLQKDISVRTSAGTVYVDLIVEALTELKDAALFMVVITESLRESGRPPGDSPVFDTGTEEIIRHLEGQLQSAREQAQAMFEELESSNEELSSANEEFQSANEELETSREELQSFNEELETVNAELNSKVSELDTTNSDLQNLLNGTQIATIFLDTELRIRNFTPAAGGMFHLLPGDAGRPITDMGAQFTDVDLVRDAREVLTTLGVRERQVTGLDGRYYQQRTLPYRTVNNVIAGVVLTFVDVTLLKRAEQAARQAQSYAESIVDAVREPLVVLDASMRVVSASKAFYENFQVLPEETISRSLFELGNGQWDIPSLRALLAEVLPRKRSIDDYEVSHVFPQLGQRTILLNGRRLWYEESESELFLLALEDITGRKRLEEERRNIEERQRAMAVTAAVQEMQAELAQVSRVVTIGELATSIAHEVNQPLAGIVTNAQASLRWLRARPANLAEVQDSLALIVRDGNRASEVIQRIREFLKKDTPTATRLDVNGVVEESLALAKAELLRDEIALRLELAPGLPLVWADRIQLQQVILNLVMNGIEAMVSDSEGARDLTVSTMNSENDHVVVAVCDSGPGLEGEEIKRMFDAFFTTKATGMGMGLSISRSIVEAYGGCIWAIRNQGSGMTVNFSLRASREAL